MPDKCHAWGTMVKLAIVKTRKVSLLKVKKGYYEMSVVYTRRVISCLKGFTSFYHIPHKDGMRMSLEIN